MHRTGLIVALTIAAVAAVVFAAFPELDLKAAGIFYPVRMGEFTFAWRLSPKLILVHNIALKAGFVLLIPFVARASSPSSSFRAGVCSSRRAPPCS